YHKVSSEQLVERMLIMATSQTSKTSSTTKKSSGTNRAITTTDHDTIRQWVESRGGHPACVKGTGGKNDIGMLRIDYPGYSGKQTLQRIDWTDFFKKFDSERLAFLYQEKTATGRQSRFSKLVARDK